MSTVFPTAIDSIVKPEAGQRQNNPSHSTLHRNEIDAIVAIQIKVGKDNSDDPTSIDYRLRTLESTPQVVEETDPVFAAWLATNPLSAYYAFDRLKYGIQPTEATDNERTEFTVPNGYVVGTLRVYMGSSSGHMRLFGITATNGTTVTVPVAPMTEESLYFDYISAS